MTRAQFKLTWAWVHLMTAHIKRGHCRPNTLERWIWVRWGVDSPGALTAAQCRHAMRQINAWRAGVEGRTALADHP